LLGSIPVPDPRQRWQTDVHIPAEDAQSPDALGGCLFYSRCVHHMDRCRQSVPPLYQLAEQAGHQCACFLCEE
jgi:oligopeptide/dipeptide ABC transporter ATP-binding protein